MDDQIIHDRIMQILNGRVAMGAGVSAGYGTKEGAKKALETRRKNKIALLEQELKEAKKLVKKAPAKKAKAPAKKAKAPAKKAKVPAKKEKKKNDKWIKFVKKYAKDNNVSYKQAQKDAGKSYREKYNKK